MRLSFARQIGFDRASLPVGAQNPKTARVRLMPGGRLQVCEPPLWIASVNQLEWNSLDAEERSTEFRLRRRNTV